MNCEICAFDASVDAVMWTCAGCPRKFHAACIGITAQRSLRNRNLVDVTSYVLPCCDSCQQLIGIKLDINRLSEQQKLLTKQLHENTEVIHRSALQQEKPSIVNDAFEGLEILLTSIKNELSTINKNSSLAGSVVAIKNHVTAVLDTAMQTSNERIANSLKKVTSELAGDLRNINNEICQLNQLSLESANTSTMNTNSMLSLDILDELKAISANIMTCHNSAPSPLPSDPFTSLETEMKDKTDDSGWRILGHRKVWKADWSQYDARKLHRKNQQKMADKAKKRRKQNKARNTLTTARNHRANSNYTRTYINNPLHFDNKNHDMKSQHNINYIDNLNRGNFLPSDRELLAVAKDRFSRPPNNYQPEIKFQRGEVLNPYPTSVIPHPAHAHPPNMLAPGSSTASCEACACNHSCFLRNRRTH